MLSGFELDHAKSIVDAAPQLEPIPPLRKPKILVASVIRKPVIVLQAWLECLRRQQFRDPGAEVSFAFIMNFAPVDAIKDEAFAFMREQKISFTEVEAPTGDYGDTLTTRMWNTSSFGRMAELKNTLIQAALYRHMDYLFLIDADVLIDPWTVQSLLDASAPIVSAVYWTNWQRAMENSTDFVHAGPQVWLRHPYFLDDMRYSEPEFREALVNRGRIPVRGLGACTLISALALNAGVNFSHVDALPPGPMSEGEDRHFCARAQRLHLPMVADAWSDVYHAYHPTEYGAIAPEVQKLFAWPHYVKPVIGALVSLKIEPLEPVPDALGRPMMLQPKWVRGRMGCLPVLPQIEEAVMHLTVGDSRIIRVMYPGHYELDWLRSQTRLFRVTLLDAKAFGFAPVIDRELFVGSSGRWMDSTTMTEPQVREIMDQAMAI